MVKKMSCDIFGVVTSFVFLTIEHHSMIHVIKSCPGDKCKIKEDDESKYLLCVERNTANTVELCTRQKKMK